MFQGSNKSSPSITIREYDDSQFPREPYYSDVVGGIVGCLSWGPVGMPLLVSNERDYRAIFGYPIRGAPEKTIRNHINIHNFLQYYDKLKIVRVGPDELVNAGSSAASILVKNAEHFSYLAGPSLDYNLVDSQNLFIARYGGEMGNSISVLVVDSDNPTIDTVYRSDPDGFTSEGTTLESIYPFTREPGTTDYVRVRGGSNDEIHIAVIDEDGLITGTKNNILEIYQGLSKAYDAQNYDGTSNYYKDVINSKSRYIYACKDLTNIPTAVGLTGDSTTDFSTNKKVISDDGDEIRYTNDYIQCSLVGGWDGWADYATEVLLYGYQGDTWDVGYNYFNLNPVHFLIDHNEIPSLTNRIAQMLRYKNQTILCVGVSAGSTGDNTDKTAAIVSYCNGITSDDAVSIIAGTKFAYEPFTDQTVAINMASDLAGLNCRTSAKERPWVSAAGFRRGNILNYDRIYYAPSKENRDTLFKKKINPVIKDEKQFFLFGDLTHIDTYTPTESIGAKRTVMIIENFLSELGPQFLYKINDTQTRIQFTTITSQFLDKLKELGGLNDFRVVCDATNNTQGVIDAGQFIGDVYIKVAKSIYYIILNFNTSRYKTNTITIR
jgi:hypothetical protein